MTVKLVKNGDVKLLDPQSSLIPALVRDGWAADGGEVPAKASEPAAEAPRRGRPPKQPLEVSE